MQLYLSAERIFCVEEIHPMLDEIAHAVFESYSRTGRLSELILGPGQAASQEPSPETP